MRGGHLHLRRQIAFISRWLHIYLSMFSFAVLLFFAFTGLTLNHADWFSAGQKSARLKGQIDTKLFQSADPKAAIVARLREAHHITSGLSDFRLDDTQCEVSFKGPGYVADAFIERDSGKYEVTETRMGWVAVMNDLHKGRDSGKAWSAIIDVSAILMTLVSATGLTLIFFLHKHRVSGFGAIAIGALICCIVYYIWVP